MSKLKERNIGFEILDDNDEYVVYKRVLPGHMSHKEKFKREMTLPKMKMTYFDRDDVERLQKLQSEIAEKYSISSASIYDGVMRRIFKFFLK